MKNHTKTITIRNSEAKELYINNVWTILFEAYKNVKGGLFFHSKEDLVASTAFWKIVMSNGEVIAVTIYKAKHGLKLVALAINDAFKEVAKKALAKIIKADLKKGSVK
jgi:hypothetical protein